MKKKYINPSMMAVVAEPDRSLLSGSVVTGNNVYEESANENKPVLSRQHSVWDDENEEE